jgi:hypothetical protein
MPNNATREQKVHFTLADMELQIQKIIISLSSTLGDYIRIYPTIRLHLLIKTLKPEAIINNVQEDGSVVVATLCYKPEGHGYETR